MLPVTPHTPWQEAERQFKAADQDQDGKLSRDEWKAKFGNDKMFDA